MILPKHFEIALKHCQFPILHKGSSAPSNLAPFGSNLIHCNNKSGCKKILIITHECKVRLLFFPLLTYPFRMLIFMHNIHKTAAAYLTPVRSQVLRPHGGPHGEETLHERSDDGTGVREATGRELTLVGDIELGFFPWLSLRTGEGRFGNAPAFGMLVLGSPDPLRFEATMGTEFLSRISALASAALSRMRPVPLTLARG